MKRNNDNNSIQRRVFIKNSALATVGVFALGANAFGNNESWILQNESGFVVPPLPYAFDAMEPHIDVQTMQIHHDKHHGAYVKNLNDAVASEKSLSEKSLEELISNLSAIPESVRIKVRNNGGGHWNHTFFWNILTPNKNTKPSEKLSSAINAKFSSMENFTAEFEKTAMSIFGSGWCWLIMGSDGNLSITKTPNQDNPLMDLAEVKGKPLLGVDVWEHAYYLKYQNKRADYLKVFWNVLNWEQASKNFS